MALKTRAYRLQREGFERGFSLPEMLASVAIITLLMFAVFTFMGQSQKRFQGDLVVAESNQGARAALEVMTQEIGQAGFNPIFNPSKTSSSTVTASSTAQCITLSDISQIFPGDWLTVDSGGASELVRVLSTSAVAGSPCTTANQIQAVFQQDHCQGPVGPACAGISPTWPYPAISYKTAHPNGILQGTGTSDDKTLEFFGDINADGNFEYVVYSLNAPAGAPTVSINGTTYTLYTLYRSITPVSFVAGAKNNRASPLVQNVLYNTTSKQGPTGQPIFSYPVTVPLSIVPTTITVVGTVVVNLSVAVSPKSLETGSLVQWYTMATQVRPLNLVAAVAVANAGGSKFLPSLPVDLPMAYPSNYYN